jgi:hypothetical protein
LVPLITQAMEHCATTGLMEYCTKMYGMKWIIRPQVDFDIGDTTDKLTGWNFTKSFEPSEDPEYAANKADWDKLKLASSLENCVKNAYESHEKRHPGLVKNKEMQLAIEPTKRVKKMLKHFPLELEPYNLKKAA